MNESELQKAVDRGELVIGARKAIKRAKQKQLDEMNEISLRSIRAKDKQTGKTMLVPVSDIMKNPSGFSPVQGSVEEMLRTSDRKKYDPDKFDDVIKKYKEERRIRKGRDRNLRIERLKAQGLGSKIKPRPGKTKAFKIGGAMSKNPGKADLDKRAIADMLKKEDRRIERKIQRESNERTAKRRIKRLTEGASPLTKSIIKKAADREPGGRLSRTDIKLAEQSLKNKFKIGGAMLKNPGKADLDKDGQLSSYEKKRGMAIEKAMAGKPQKALLGKLFRKKSGKATPGVMMIEGSPGGMGGLLKKLLKGKKFSKGGGKDMGSKQAMQDFLDKVNKDPILKRIRPDRSKLLEMLERTKPTPKPLQSRPKPRIASVQKKMMGGGLTEATNRLRAQGKMGGGMMNTMGYKKGKSVMAKGCKMGRKKPTKLY